MKYIIVVLALAVSAGVMAQQQKQGHSHGPGTHTHGSDTHKHSTAPERDHEHGPNVKATLEAQGPLVRAEKTSFVIRLSGPKGEPLGPDALEVTHTERVHLLIVDPSLDDYHHVHPTPGAEAGAYEFAMTPQKAGEYIVFVDVKPAAFDAGGYARATFVVPGEAEAVEEGVGGGTIDGYTYCLTFQNPNVQRGRANLGRFSIADPNHKDYDQLEPVMGAFAHFVAFSEDRQSIAHIHPLGEEPATSDARGAVPLEFSVNFDRPGFWRVWSQVKFEGEERFIPFGVTVAEPVPPASVKDVFVELDRLMLGLEQVIRTKQLAQVHGLAFEAADYLALLPDLAAKEGADRDDIQRRVQRLTQGAELLDRYGDANDERMTGTMFDRFGREMRELKDALKVSGLTPVWLELGSVTAAQNETCPVTGKPVGSLEPGAMTIQDNRRIDLCCSGCARRLAREANEAPGTAVH